MTVRSYLFVLGFAHHSDNEGQLWADHCGGATGDAVPPGPIALAADARAVLGAATVKTTHVGACGLPMDRADAHKSPTVRATSGMPSPAPLRSRRRVAVPRHPKVES